MDVEEETTAGPLAGERWAARTSLSWILSNSRLAMEDRAPEVSLRFLAMSACSILQLLLGLAKLGFGLLLTGVTGYPGVLALLTGDKPGIKLIIIPYTELLVSQFIIDFSY